MLEMGNARVNGYNAATSKHHHGNDQSSKIQFLAVPKRMRVVSRSPTSMKSEEQ
jgi:hypothetical protein